MEIRQKDGTTRLGKTFEQEILPEDLRQRLGLDGEGRCSEDQAYGVDRAYRKNLSAFPTVGQRLLSPVDSDLAKLGVWLQLFSTVLGALRALVSNAFALQLHDHTSRIWEELGEKLRVILKIPLMTQGHFSRASARLE